MHLPLIKKEKRYKRSIVNFGGINLSRLFQDGELADCNGISHSEFPSITQRKKREMEFGCTAPTCAILGKDECIAAEDGLYYNRKKVGDLSPGKKQIVALGKDILVFPDKLCYDTESGKLSPLDGQCQTKGVTVTFTGKSIGVESNIYSVETEKETMELVPGYVALTCASVTVSEGVIKRTSLALRRVKNISVGTIFFEKCKKNQYRTVTDITYSEKSGYYEIKTELGTVVNLTKDLFNNFEVGDTVVISGCTAYPENNKEAIITSKSDILLTFADGTFTGGTETENITIKKKIPDFTSVCVFENRLWGTEGNTIYASALGDATAFYTYNGISTDSYSIQSNSAGDFTACIPYGNSCFFFKEASCYKLYGNRPANFSLSECFGAGILNGDAGSIVTVDGKLLYKGNGGIYSFYGSTPVRISDKLGNVKMENVSGGTDGKLYYISADTENGREEFIWDTEKNLWCKSGVNDIYAYASYGDSVYCLKPGGVEKISDEIDEDAEWSITLCPFDEKYYGTKNYSRLRIKAELFKGAFISIEVKYDNQNWEHIATFYGEDKKHINIPCVIKNCHEFHLRLSGKGKSILESIVREFGVN